jgi:hydrogenase maturation protease
MTVDAVLRFASGLGGECAAIVIVGCEPASLEPGIGLSEAVCASVECAADRVMQLIGSRVA